MTTMAAAFADNAVHLKAVPNTPDRYPFRLMTGASRQPILLVARAPEEGDRAGSVDQPLISIAKREEEIVNAMTRKDMETHVAVIGWLQIVNSLLSIVVGAFVAALLLGVGVAVEDEVALRIMVATGLAVAGLLLVLSLPGLVAGIGLLRHASWARIMAQVLAVFELVLFPIGTLLGIYTIFVLSQRAAPEVFGACCALEESRVQAEGA